MEPDPEPYEPPTPAIEWPLNTVISKLPDSIMSVQLPMLSALLAQPIGTHWNSAADRSAPSRFQPYSMPNRVPNPSSGPEYPVQRNAPRDRRFQARRGNHS